MEDDAGRSEDRYESAMYGVERSFRLIFPSGEEIMFFADTDEEKNKWYVSFDFFTGSSCGMLKMVV